ncbi:Serine/threonine-protein kinase smg-1 [Bienertia sinuspersici]
MFDFLSDHKNLLSANLFPLFGIEHQLQRFDRRLVAFYHIVSNEVLP